MTRKSRVCRRSLPRALPLPALLDVVSQVAHVASFTVRVWLVSSRVLKITFELSSLSNQTVRIAYFALRFRQALCLAALDDATPNVSGHSKIVGDVMLG